VWWTAELSDWVDNDGVSAALELGDQAPGMSLLVPLLQPFGPEVAVGFVALKHVVGADKDRVGGRYLGPFGAAARRYPGLLRGQIRVLTA